MPRGRKIALFTATVAPCEASAGSFGLVSACCAAGKFAQKPIILVEAMNLVHTEMSRVGATDNCINAEAQQTKNQACTSSRARDKHSRLPACRVLALLQCRTVPIAALPLQCDRVGSVTRVLNTFISCLAIKTRFRTDPPRARARLRAAPSGIARGPLASSRTAPSFESDSDGPASYCCSL